jgi:hypothetical protein
VTGRRFGLIGAALLCFVQYKGDDIFQRALIQSRAVWLCAHSSFLHA